MILAVGYRVRSKRAIEFRRWSSSILKKYLTNGYVINKDRITITEQNYINLINDVNDIDYRLTKLEEKISDYHLVDTLIFEDTFFEPKVIINKLIEAAKERIVLIDPYIDINTLDAFKNKNRDVKLMIITFVNRLSDIEINAFIHDYGDLEIVVNDSYHDRYLIIDNINYYHFGASINYLGKRLSQITKIASQDIIETLNRRIDMYL